MALRERVKWLLFPGMNLHARLRRRVLPAYFGRNHLVLDAGCGNGMLSYEAYRRGSRVIGVSIKAKEVEGCRRLFNEFLRIPEDRLSFRVHNLYEVEKIGPAFDEIVCSEVLEHIQRDADVCRSFWNMLKPGGVLHLCAPNAEHPDNVHGDLDRDEDGGHVRPGYTLASYKALLEPIGFRIDASAGVGGPIREFFNRRMIVRQAGGHPWIAAGLFGLALLLVWFDPAKPSVPYSIYVRAVKG